MTRHAWLQKHPTPAARGGEFHWYPADGDGELRAGFAERLAGAGDGVLWQLAPGQVAWALPFVATAPLDNRRYTGLALAIEEGEEDEEGDAAPATLLARLAPPIAAPWIDTRDDEHLGVAARDIARPGGTLPDLVGVARALLDGGAASVGDPRSPALPAAIAAIERVMPASVTARVRRGRWIAGEGTRGRAGELADPRGTERVAGLAVAAATAPGSRAARAWRVACELAAPGRSIDAVVAAAEHELAPAGWVPMLNAWGRGKLARELDVLADRVALRVLARLIADRDPAWAIAEARWHALLPAPRRAELLAAVARRAESLRGLVDG